MNLSLVTGPSGYPVSEEEARDHLRIDGNDSDLYLKGLIACATDIVEKITRRALLTQTWKVFFDCFPDREIQIPLAKLQSVTHLKYYDSGDILQTVSGSSYIVDSVSEPGRITPLPYDIWPITNFRPNAVEVQFVAGYGKADQVPMPIRQAILMLISHWYENREPVAINVAVMPVPKTVDFLLSSYRVLRFF